MPSVLCLGCGRAIEFTDDEIGQNFQCLGCGCEVLAEPQAEYDAAPPPVRGAAGWPIAFDEPEPWYYGFLVTYANVVKWVAVVAAVVTLSACLVALVLVGVTSREPLAIVAGVLFLVAVMVYANLFLLAVFCWVAWVLLTVDAGRNLREMRAIMARRGGQ
jgi:hypothetical protein